MQRSIFWRSCQVIFRIMSTLLFDFKTYGRENVPKAGGALLISNHQSYLDPPLMAVQLYRPVSYMAKSELFRNKALAWLIRSLHAFPINQTGFAKGAIDETINQLHAGKLLNMYPEGTRTETGELGTIQRGIALVLRKVDVPIIPVAIEGAYKAWPNRQKMFKAHSIRIMYGKPMNLKGMKGDAIVKEVDATLRDLIRQLREKIADEKRRRE